MTDRSNKYQIWWWDDDEWKSHETHLSWPDVVHMLMHNEKDKFQIELVEDG